MYPSIPPEPETLNQSLFRDAKGSTVVTNCNRWSRAQTDKVEKISHAQSHEATRSAPDDRQPEIKQAYVDIIPPLAYESTPMRALLWSCPGFLDFRNPAVLLRVLSHTGITSTLIL